MFRVVATAQSVDTTTGEWDSDPLTGRTDGTLHLASSIGGAALGSTSTALTESAATGVYRCTITAAVLSAALGSLPDGATVWAVPIFGTQRCAPSEYTWSPVVVE